MSLEKLNFKRVHPDATTPTRANETDAGFDLYALDDSPAWPRKRVLVRTGIAMEIPEGHVGLIWPRSGLAVKHGIDVMAGVVDSGYRGEIKVLLQNTDPDLVHKIHKGDRIAQILIQPIVTPELVEVDDLGETERGAGGFGSTGK